MLIRILPKRSLTAYSFAKLKLQAVQQPIFNIIEAVQMVKSASKRNFDETIDFQLKLNVNPKHGDQNVRGNCLMPGGLGKNVIIAAFLPQSLQEDAKKAGADIVGDQEIIDLIKLSKFEFDKLVTVPEMMPNLKQYARILGPRGLMPNPKAGTLLKAESISSEVRNAKSGQIEFKVDSGKNLFVPVGKVSFEESRILSNIKAFSLALNEKKPTSIKGAFIKEANIKTTMGKRVRVEIGSFDQKNKQNLLSEY